MGEKIAILGSAVVSGTEVEIELNHPPRAGLERQVHLQTDRMRYEMSEDDFVRFAATVSLGKANLKRIKKLK